MTDVAPPSAKWKRDFLKGVLDAISEEPVETLDQVIQRESSFLEMQVEAGLITKEEAEETKREGAERALKARKRKRKPRKSMPPEAESIGPDGEVSTRSVVLVPGTHVTSDGDRVEVGMSKFADAVLAKLPTETLYERCGIVGQIRAGRFEPVSPSSLRYIIDRNVRLARWRRDREAGGQFLEFEHCISDWAGVVHSIAHRAARPLRLITKHPVCTPDGISKPGYHDGIYYFGEEIEPNMDIAECNAILAELVVDFPFAELADRHNYYGLLVTPILRFLIDGPVPMHMIMSSIERTGKTKLVDDVFGRVILDGPCPAMQFSANEEERDKRFTGLLARCSQAVHFDNLNEFLDSASLCSFITARTHSGRILGKSEITEFPQDLTLIGTANNPRGTAEVVKRCVPIILRPDRDDPENRSEFIHNDLAAYVKANRKRILAALLGLCIHGLQNRQRYTFGGFESWASLVGSVAHAAGWTAWRTNREAWAVQADQETLDLRAFVEAWQKKFGMMSTPVGLLHPVAREANVFAGVFSKPTERGQISGLGRVLAKYLNRPVGTHRICRTLSGNNPFYYLETLK